MVSRNIRHFSSGALKPRPFLKTPFNEREAQLSLDGHWVAYVSDDSQRAEIYVKAQKLVHIDTALTRFIQPIERVLGVTLLGQATVRSFGSGNTGFIP